MEYVSVASRGLPLNRSIRRPPGPPLVFCVTNGRGRLSRGVSRMRTRTRTLGRTTVRESSRARHHAHAYEEVPVRNAVSQVAQTRSAFKGWLRSTLFGMRDLPRGTVTFLFTDIEGSTQLLERLGPSPTRRRSNSTGACCGERSPGTTAPRWTHRATLSSSSSREPRPRSPPPRRRSTRWPTRRCACASGSIPVSRSRRPKATSAWTCTRAPDRRRRSRRPGAALEQTRDLVRRRVRDLGEHRLKDLTAPRGSTSSATRTSRR